jgi:hypothetical protein
VVKYEAEALPNKTTGIEYVFNALISFFASILIGITRRPDEC